MKVQCPGYERIGRAIRTRLHLDGFVIFSARSIVEGGEPWGQNGLRINQS
jgi:hypothetical protein